MLAARVGPVAAMDGAVAAAVGTDTGELALFPSLTPPAAGAVAVGFDGGASVGLASALRAWPVRRLSAILALRNSIFWRSISS